jgi:hypothetical protein
LRTQALGFLTHLPPALFNSLGKIRIRRAFLLIWRYSARLCRRDRSRSPWIIGWWWRGASGGCQFNFRRFIA